MSSPADKRRLPIGVQTFREVREECGYYVDKTEFARQLIKDGKYYFLSRPRRFGKSLFVSTLRALFECKRELFEGLAVEPHWDWSQPSPVVSLSFGRGNFREPTRLHRTLLSQLRSHERRVGAGSESPDPSDRLAELLETLHERTGRRVVVLVDEYDKPILDVLRDPDIARANRDDLRGVYAVIKDCDEHIRFCFLTGVSKFSKVSLFSGLNNLEDITLDPHYSSLCGYTERDLDTVFADQLAGLDREQIRAWYNGYSWGGEERVYNPFDVLQLLKGRRFKNWWFETGSPTFLIDLLLDEGVVWHEIDGMVTSEDLLSTFDVEHIAPEALLFQTGYLTVLESEEVDDEVQYRLGYPNREVRQSLNRALLGSLPVKGPQRGARRKRLRDVLATGDLSGLQEQLRALLAGIPHQWHGQNPMGDYEGWYASVLYAHFAALGVEVRAEESGSRGRTDLVVQGYSRIWLFEFKMRERAGPGSALQQLKERGYADRYRGLGRPIHLVGVEFSAETRNVLHYESQTVRPDEVLAGGPDLR